MSDITHHQKAINKEDGKKVQGDVAQECMCGAKPSDNFCVQFFFRGWPGQFAGLNIYLIL